MTQCLEPWSWVAEARGRHGSRSQKRSLTEPEAVCTASGWVPAKGWLPERLCAALLQAEQPPLAARTALGPSFSLRLREHGLQLPRPSMSARTCSARIIRPCAARLGRLGSAYRPSCTAPQKGMPPRRSAAFLDEEYNRQEKKGLAPIGLGKYLIILAIGVRAGPPRGARRAFELGQERTLLLAVLVEAELCSRLQAAVRTPVPLVVFINMGPCLAAYCAHRCGILHTFSRVVIRSGKKKR